jgi:hypothetical protein
VYIAALLEKQRRDHATDVTYARRKLVAAVRWRSEAAAAAVAAAAATAAAAAAAAAAGEAADEAAGAGEAATAAGEEAAAAGEAAAAWDLAAPAATHSVVRRVPSVRRLLRGGRPEPLLSDAALRAAGRVLRGGEFLLAWLLHTRHGICTACARTCTARHALHSRTALGEFYLHGYDVGGAVML